MKLLTLIKNYVFKALQHTIAIVLILSRRKIKAFTFIEMMFSLFIFSLTMSLVPPLFQAIQKLNVQINDTSLINYEFFAQDITRELNGVPINEIYIEKRRMKIDKRDKQIYYIFNNHKLYKNINQHGNVTLIGNISSCKFTKINNQYIKVELTLVENREKYYKVLIL
ncbi:competence type IV pilus minor pilin ComGF [Staphylococcus simulans]|uniref:competence type IV pilus minor pilin ComGF n=1 Tax=Staphylococcus simulans TaxID=1286 RepID=UPI003F7FD954